MLIESCYKNPLHPPSARYFSAPSAVEEQRAVTQSSQRNTEEHREELFIIIARAEEM